MQETNKLNSRNTTCNCWLTSTDKFFGFEIIE